MTPLKKNNKIVDKNPSDPSTKLVIFKIYIQIIDAKNNLIFKGISRRYKSNNDREKKIIVIWSNNLSMADNGLKSSINDTTLNIVREK